MGRLLLFILIITFVAIVSTLPIKKSKPKVFSVKSKHDAYKLLTEMGYNQCENPFDSETDKLNRPPCQTGFESVLEAFQKAYHLPVTKKLDSATLKLLNTPRCGIPDGPSASVNRRTLWSTNRTLLWRLDYKTMSYDKTHARRIIQESFDDWSKYTNLNFREAIGNEQADFNLAFVTGKHGDGTPFPSVKRAVYAHGFYPWHTYRGQIHFNSIEDWTHEYKDNGQDTNLRIVATHEIGHALGLSHSLSTDAIMYPNYQLKQPEEILPKEDQIAIQSLYGNKTTTTSKNCVIHSDNPQSKYKGECKDGMKHGHGILTRADGEKYEGNWVNDMKSGNGTIIWANGGKYTGDWVNDKQNGQGIRTWPNGDWCESNWVNGKRSGKGRVTWANGGNYTGDWVSDQRTGQGISIWPNGDRCEGNWVNGKMSGKGTCIWAGGIKYVGDWVNNNMHGEGIKIWANGDRYQGTFKNDVPVDGTMTSGRISGDDHAKKRCPIVCQGINLKWNGHWATARWKAMSFCICIEMNELSY